MTTREMAIRDMLNVINDAPCTFTHNATEFTGTIGPLANTTQLMEGGLLSEPDLILSTTMQTMDQDGVFADRFTTIPIVGDKVTIDSVDYRIERVSTDEFDAVIQFDLMTPHK